MRSSSAYDPSLHITTKCSASRSESEGDSLSARSARPGVAPPLLLYHVTV